MNGNNGKKGKWIGKAVICTAVLLAAFFGTKTLLPALSPDSSGKERVLEQTENGEETVSVTGETQAGTLSSTGLPKAAVGSGISVNTGEIPHLESRYLLAGLSGDLKENFAELYRTAANFENFCYFPKPITREETELLMTLLHTECPELFHNDSGQTYHMETVGDLVKSVTVPYSIGKEQYDKELAGCLEAVAEIAAKAEAREDAFGKELEVYREICSRCVYEQDGVRSGDAAGVLVGGKGKCDGISLAFKWVMDELGIPCIVVAATHRTEGMTGHAWNLVKIGDDWCVVDVTQDCDAGNRSILCYPAFNISEDFYEKEYQIMDGFRELGLPECRTMEKSYHVRNGSYVGAGKEKEGFYLAMSRAAAGGGAAPVQFESEDGWKRFQENSKTWAQDWMNENGFYGTSSYLAIDTFRTAQVSVTVNENSARMREISDSLAAYESRVASCREELETRKAGVDRLASEMEQLAAQAEEMISWDTETWTDEEYDEYDFLAEQHEALRERYTQEVNEYNSLIETYRELCETYNGMVREYNALTESGS